MAVVKSKRGEAASEFVKQADIVFDTTNRLIRKLYKKTENHRHMCNWFIDCAYRIRDDAFKADTIYVIDMYEAKERLDYLDDARGILSSMLGYTDRWMKEAPALDMKYINGNNDKLDKKKIINYAGTIMKALGAFTSAVKSARTRFTNLQKKTEDETMLTLAKVLANPEQYIQDYEGAHKRKDKQKPVKPILTSNEVKHIIDNVFNANIIPLHENSIPDKPAVPASPDNNIDNNIHVYNADNNMTVSNEHHNIVNNDNAHNANMTYNEHESVVDIVNHYHNIIGRTDDIDMRNVHMNSNDKHSVNPWEHVACENESNEHNHAPDDDDSVPVSFWDELFGSDDVLMDSNDNHTSE